MSKSHDPNPKHPLRYLQISMHKLPNFVYVDIPGVSSSTVRFTDTLLSSSPMAFTQTWRILPACMT